jgi:hypothetical protein
MLCNKHKISTLFYLFFLQTFSFQLHANCFSKIPIKLFFQTPTLSNETVASERARSSIAFLSDFWEKRIKQILHRQTHQVQPTNHASIDLGSTTADTPQRACAACSTAYGRHCDIRCLCRCSTRAARRCDDAHRDSALRSNTPLASASSESVPTTEQSHTNEWTVFVVGGQIIVDDSTIYRTTINETAYVQIVGDVVRRRGVAIAVAARRARRHRAACHRQNTTTKSNSCTRFGRRLI